DQFRVPGSNQQSVVPVAGRRQHAAESALKHSELAKLGETTQSTGGTTRFPCAGLCFLRFLPSQEGWFRAAWVSREADFVVCGWCSRQAQRCSNCRPPYLLKPFTRSTHPIIGLFSMTGPKRISPRT